MAEMRLAHQETVLDVAQPKLTVVIGEGALNQIVREPEVMREQVRHLAEVSAERPRITVHVLPLGSVAYASGGGGPLEILRFAGATELGVVRHTAAWLGRLELDPPWRLETAPPESDTLDGGLIWPHRCVVGRAVLDLRLPRPVLILQATSSRSRWSARSEARTNDLDLM
jgi:hypothetical protein